MWLLIHAEITFKAWWDKGPLVSVNICKMTTEVGTDIGTSYLSRIYHMRLNAFVALLVLISPYSGRSRLQYIPRNMHTVFALLCFVVVIHWLIFPYPSALLHWHCGNLTIAPVPAKQPWWIWINTSCEFIMNDCITTTKQSTTKLCAYFLGYTVVPWLLIACQCKDNGEISKYNFRFTTKNISTWRFEICREWPNITSESKVHVANIEPTWVLSDPCGPHVGPINFAIRDGFHGYRILNTPTKTMSAIDYSCSGLRL